MAGLLGPDFDPTVPADTEDVSQGAARIRDIKTRIKAFLSAYFNLDTGDWLDDSITPNALQDVVGLTPDTYTLATVQVDQKGRVIAITSGSIGSYKVVGAVETPATGGTGQASVPTSGNLLVGTSSGAFALFDPTAAGGGGTGIIITPGDGVLAFSLDPAYFPAIPFFFSGTLPSATATTPVQLVPDFTTGPLAGRKVYLSDFIARVDGATAWATTTAVTIQDTNGTPVSFVSIAVAALTGNAIVQRGTSGVTLADAITRATGGTASKGLQMRGDVNGTGSNLIVSVWGFYK